MNWKYKTIVNRLIFPASIVISTVLSIPVGPNLTKRTFVKFGLASFRDATVRLARAKCTQLTPLMAHLTSRGRGFNSNESTNPKKAPGWLCQRRGGAEPVDQNMAPLRHRSPRELVEAPPEVSPESSEASAAAASAVPDTPSCVVTSRRGKKTVCCDCVAKLIVEVVFVFVFLCFFSFFFFRPLG